MLNFLAEISQMHEVYVRLIPTTREPRNFNLYEININPPPEQSYWTDWGGVYDNFVGSEIELYFTQFLPEVTTIGEVRTTSFRKFTRNGIVLVNLPMHPWFFAAHTSEARSVIPFLSSAIDPDNPSNNIVNNTPALVKLEIPSTNVRLSDSFNGINLKQGFSLNISNNDGNFDDETFWKLFNTPVTLKKSITYKPSYTDFINIGSGFIQGVDTIFDNLRINVGDKLSSMNEQVCKIISFDTFPYLDIRPSALNRNIPVVYGTRRINLLQIRENQYLTAEGVTSVSNVRDRDGNIVTGWTTTISGESRLLLINSNTQIATAMVQGHQNNRIGQIIRHLVEQNTNIPFNPTEWNIAEVNAYTNISPRINIEINSGTVRRVIEDVLRNDMAYFIQQLDGRFTIRRYGRDYQTHSIDSSLLVKNPDKDYSSAQNNYFSSCIINWYHAPTG